MMKKSTCSSGNWVIVWGSCGMEAGIAIVTW
jgi:hypothetical protein